MNNTKPFIVGVGGARRPNSSTEKALKIALRAAADAGADVALFSGSDLDLPLYAPEVEERTEPAQRLVTWLRRADGVILGSPGYHGGVSGLVKNALDYTEDMRGDQRPYFDGRAVGCIATGAGWQGAAATLSALRSIVHALRGWPTPLGGVINTAETVFDAQGDCLSEPITFQLQTVAWQVMEFATRGRK